MKFLILIIILLLESIYLKGQTICVYDEDTRMSIPYVSISIYDDHKKIIFQGTANDEGCLQIPDNISRKNIVLQLYSLNYHTREEAVDLENVRDYWIGLKKLSQTLDEVVVTGESVPMEKENSVLVVKSISEQKIQTMGAQNLKDVLLNENNIRLTNDPVLGTNINILGLSGQAVKILVDGVPVIGRLNGNIDLSQINLNNVQKIEIIEGPMAVKFGTDAMGGVINIITKKNREENVADKLLAYYESNGTYNINNNILFKLRKHHISFNLGRNFFDGWRYGEKPFYIEKVRIADTLRNKLWKPREQYYLTINDEIQLKKITLGLYADGFYEMIYDRGKPFAPYFENAIDNFYKTIRNTQRITTRGFIFKNYYLDFVMARNDYIRYKNAYFNDLTIPEKQISNNVSDHDTSRYTMYMSRASLSGKVLKHTAEIGYDAYSEQTYISIIKNRIANQIDVAGFFSYALSLGKHLTVKPAIRVSYNSLYKTLPVPSVHVLYNFKNKTQQDSLHNNISSIRFSYARGFRSPSLKELFLNFVDINHNIIGNPNLKPELSDFWNIHYRFKVNTNKTSYSADLNGFYNDVKNVIMLGMINTIQYSYLNVDRIQTAGVGLANTFTFKSITLSPKISWIGKNLILQHTNQFYFYPEIIFNAQHDSKKYRAGINVFSKYTGKVPYVRVISDTDNALAYISDYFWLDVNAYKHFWQKKIQLTIGVKNLFNLTTLNLAGAGGAHSSSSVLLGTGRTYFFQFILNI
ncbi:MAG: hypothetical protein Fur0023_07780 [Bacteroidia bacterium]